MKELPERAPTKPVPARIGSDREVRLVPAAAAKRDPLPGEATLDGPKECHAPSRVPALPPGWLRFVQPPELRPPLKRAALLEVPNECHWPFLIAE